MDAIPYKKSFNGWNEYKKVVDDLDIDFNFFYHEREVWRCSVGVNVGVEVDGKHTYFERPVLVVVKFNKEMFWGLPLTSRDRKGAFFNKITYDTGVSWAMLSQLRTFSSKRLIRKMGIVSEMEFQEICTRLCAFIEKSKPSAWEGFSEAEATNTNIVSRQEDKSNPCPPDDVPAGDSFSGGRPENEVK